MPINDTSFSQVISNTVTINCTPAKVWAAITDLQLMKQWMSETEIEIVTDWIVGSPIVIKGQLAHHSFENNGVVLQFEPAHVLQYSHLSSLSVLPDQVENYSLIEFRLIPKVGQTNLTLTLSNFPDKIIYHHLTFYWNITLNVLRQFCEANN